MCLFNFTIYANDTNGYCHLYDEVNGTKGCNEVATCIYEYLKKLPSTVTHITTWSDTCAAQNRNHHLMSMFIYAVNSIDNLNTVDVKYLESGHSYLECDSMHGIIERKLKRHQVYSPPEMRMILETARIDPKPYTMLL